MLLNYLTTNAAYVTLYLQGSNTAFLFARLAQPSLVGRMAPSRTIQDILSMLRVTSGMIAGPAMHEVESALTEADIGEDDVARIQTLASDLQKLVQVAAKARKQPRIEYPQVGVFSPCLDPLMPSGTAVSLALETIGASIGVLILRKCPSSLCRPPPSTLGFLLR